MKTYLIFSIFVLILAGTSCKTTNKGVKANPHARQQQYLPVDFKNLYFGMSMDEFKKIRGVEIARSGGSMDFRVEYTESMFKNPLIKEVTYYFDAENHYPLYELIITYANADERDKVAARYLGSPNNGDEWRFPSGEGFDIKAWKFDNKLVIIGKLLGTEWDNN